MERLDAVLTRHGFSMGLVLVAAGALLVGTLLIWHDPGPELPRAQALRASRKPSSKVPSKGATGKRLLERQRKYLHRLVADARRYDVDLEPKKLFSAFPYFVTEGPVKLPARGGRLVTAQLRLRTTTRLLDTPLGSHGRYKALTIVLSVENRTDEHIVFRVLTRPSGKAECRSKAALAQTTFVLGPRGALSRTECLAAKGRDSLTVQRIDVMSIPALSYHYLVKLRPTAVLLSARTSAGHTPPAGHSLCGSLPRQRIQRGLQAGSATWADVMDYYGRYCCDHFDFRLGYRRPGPEPARSPPLPNVR